MHESPTDTLQGDMAEGDYELWFNWEYSIKHKPHLMSLGRGGSMAIYRKQWLKELNAWCRSCAEDCFWNMVRENDEDAERKYPRDTPRTKDEIRQLWISDALDMDNDLYAYVREVGSKGSPTPWWRKLFSIST